VTGSETHAPVTPANVGRIVWRQKTVSAVVFLLIAAIGCAVVLARPRTYESSSSIALLPESVNTDVLPNYPDLIASLIPTYVQLVSSPALLDQVAAGLPFHTSGIALANEVSGQSLSNAAVINIVARSSNPTQARQIATEATKVFLSQLQDNGVVIPTVYGLPSATPTLAPPRTSLLLTLVLVLAVILALAASLIWDRLPAPTRHAATVLVRTSWANTVRAIAGKRAAAAPGGGRLRPDRSVPGTSDGSGSVSHDSESTVRLQPRRASKH
jgi:capsular polysaccharide biosynthesis protein